MMIKEHISPLEWSQTRITEYVLGGLEPEWFEFAMVSLEVGEKVGTRARAIDKVPQDRGPKQSTRSDRVRQRGGGGDPYSRRKEINRQV